MATKSILKNVSITDKRLAKGLLSALENAEKKQSKAVELKIRLEEVKGEDIKEALGTMEGWTSIWRNTQTLEAIPK